MSRKQSGVVNGFAEVALSRAIDIDGAAVKVLRMREPTVGDQLAIDDMKGGESVREVALLANLCEVSPEDIKRLTLKDYRALQQVFMGFIG